MSMRTRINWQFGLRAPGPDWRSLADVTLFQIREIRKQLLDGASCRKRLDNHADGHAHSPDTGLTAHDLRIDRDSLDLLHVVMIAQFAEASTLPKAIGALTVTYFRGAD